MPNDLTYLIRGGKDDPFLPHLLRAIDSATEIRIAVSFTRSSGLRLIIGALQDALDRDVPLQFLTSDYLDVTEPDALRRLLLLQDSGASIRVHSCENGISFHPKAYIFIRDFHNGVAFVGSSNLSQSALLQGIEWNICIDGNQTPGAFQQACRAFDTLFAGDLAHELTWEWISRYEERRLPPAVDADEILCDQPKPHDIQKRALEALRNTRSAGMQRGLVVMATGVGKTWLAVFDSLQGEFPRVLFVAHREEILNQAAATFLAVRPKARIGFYHGSIRATQADILFGSVQSLGRKSHLHLFARDAFDYIIIDEFHHASAGLYQNILNYFTPSFLLGLTATPERTDRQDIEVLCDNNLVFRVDLTEAIEGEFLCPFTYYGIHDRHVNYESISWRNRSFDPQMLEDALDTKARAEQIFDEWKVKAQQKTLGFCASINHAEFMATYFRSRGVAAVAVHSRSDIRRHDALDGLSEGLYQVIFSVDLFNEGVDIPSVDTVLMIRPTQSPVVYLQQLGRGLRKDEGKERLVVLDFIGNHRSFLLGPQALFGLRPGSHQFTAALEAFKMGTFDLPRGCQINFDLEVIDLLGRLARITRNPDHIYKYLKDLNGVRPTALEMSNYGISFTVIRNRHGSWLEMLHKMGDIEQSDFDRISQHVDFFREMEKTSLTKCFKLITLEAMLELGGFINPPTTLELADKSLAVLLRRPALLDDIHQKFHPTGQIRTAMAAEWHRYWLDNPINALIGGNSRQRLRVFFEVIDGRFVYREKVNNDTVDVFEGLLQEIVNCRLVGYNPDVHEIDEVVCKLFNRGTTPIIKLNDRRRDSLPTGDTDVVINNEIYSVRFAKIAVNVIKDSSNKNVITEILRGWFGASAGMPGQLDQVRFVRKNGRWKMEPVQVRTTGEGDDSSAVVVDINEYLLQEPCAEERFRTCVPFYSLRPAAGPFRLDPAAHLNDQPAGWVPVDDAREGMFLLEIIGKSMEPTIPDRSLCLFRAGSALGGSRVGRVVLVRSSGVRDPDNESGFTVKRYYSTKVEDPDGGWQHTEIRLKPDNPEFETIVLTPEEDENFKVVAEFIRVVSIDEFGRREESLT